MLGRHDKSIATRGSIKTISNARNQVDIKIQRTKTKRYEMDQVNNRKEPEWKMYEEVKYKLTVITALRYEMNFLLNSIVVKIVCSNRTTIIQRMRK